MGRVYFARRCVDDTEVAIKLAFSSGGPSPELTERLAREASALAALDHPHVVKVLDSGSLPDGRFYLVTELATGGTMAERLRAGPLAPAEVAARFSEIVLAVGAAHAAGILHRDLKPANILLDAGGGVRLADFSLARMVEPGLPPSQSLTGGDVFGTPYYLAPEARKGMASLDERADIFSLGVLLHEMLTGRVPIGHYLPASELAGVPKAVDALIARCLAEDPERRPADAGTLLEEFHRAWKGPSRSRKLVFALGLVVTLVLVAVSFVPGWLRPRGVDGVGPLKNARVSAAQATRSQPFINSLGMKFVPVPASNLLFSVWETRRRDFEAFAPQASARIAGAEARWRHPPVPAGADEPVCFVDWPAAREFCAWLTTRERVLRKIGSNDVYRLPSDAEWSLAAGLPEESGQTPEERELRMRESRPHYPWGRTWPPPETLIQANFAGSEATDLGARTGVRFKDPFPHTAPVGSFPPNEFGLHDISGNVAEWCDTTWNRTSDEKVLRGGSWDQAGPGPLNLTYRQHLLPVVGLPGSGFRVVLQLSPDGRVGAAAQSNSYP